MYYVKKPMPIQAVKIPEDLIEDCTWIRDEAPQWLINALINGTAKLTKGGINIKTLEGNMLCKFGDYLICGVRGELYPCHSEIFEETYELTSDKI